MTKNKIYRDEIEQHLDSSYNRGVYNALLYAQKNGITKAIECYIPQFLKEPEEDGLVRNCKIFSIVEVR